MPKFNEKTLNRLWILSHFDWIFANRSKLKTRPCANFIVTGFVINSFACPYYGYAIDKITVGNLIDLWEKCFISKGFPLIHYRISHGDTSTHIAYVYRGKVFRHRFLWNDEKKYVPTEEVKSIFRNLRNSKL
ncbi:MAG: hypothetical protein IJ830_04695 [Alphaproteobacteria bacterium]|nr:hypothetical protein [Alphaproteobacteria bacterium]